VLTLRGKPGVRRGSDLGNLEIIEDGSVFIRDGKIVCVGPTRRLENLKAIRDALEIPAHNCIVMPGFVDPSIRLSLTGLDNNGLLKRRKLSDFHDESITLMRSCLQHGTLNAGIRACSGIHSLGADLSVLRQLARIGDTPVGLTRIWHPNAGNGAVPETKTLAETLHIITRLKLADSLELNTLETQLDPLASVANEAEMALNLDWLGGAADDLKSALHRYRAATVFLSQQISEAECEVLMQSNAIAVFNASEKLLDGQPDGLLRKLADAGGAVALGSGYDAQHELNYNMQLVVALAVRRMRLTTEEAIVASTVNAAYALNCGHQLGSLEPGKRAEVLVLNLSDYREIPRRLGVNHVAMAIRDGNLAFQRLRGRVGAA
jgi:imidazolonepropionase